jgi:hypothetical protein
MLAFSVSVIDEVALVKSYSKKPLALYPVNPVTAPERLVLQDPVEIQFWT